MEHVHLNFQQTIVYECIVNTLFKCKTFLKNVCKVCLHIVFVSVLRCKKRSFGEYNQYLVTTRSIMDLILFFAKVLTITKAFKYEQFHLILSQEKMKSTNCSSPRSQQVFHTSFLALNC
jgi:hypothetical protein